MANEKRKKEKENKILKKKKRKRSVRYLNLFWNGHPRAVLYLGQFVLITHQTHTFTVRHQRLVKIMYHFYTNSLQKVSETESSGED